MKLLKRLFFVLALALLVVLPVSCIEQGAHVHQYGEWTLSVEPTETTPGKAERVCTIDGHPMKMSVAVLTDTSVWTVDEEKSVAPTCKAAGKTVYTSAFGTVERSVAPADHEYTSWEITAEPTLTAPGKVTRTCKYGETEEAELAVLTDTKVWTVKEHVDSTCQVEGKDVYTSMYGDVTVALPKADHVYGEWTLTADPTMEATGKAARVCKYGETDEVDVPVLTDTTVWKVVEKMNPTCQVEGSAVYRSMYGDVTIVLPKAEHVYGEWTLSTEPTETTAGKAVRTCKYGETDEIEVPVLTDTSVWTVKEVIDPGYIEEGATIYTSIYGDVRVVIAKLVADYQNKTYVGFAVDSDDYTFKALTSFSDKFKLTIDENGNIPATSYSVSAWPFNMAHTVTMADNAGKLSIVRSNGEISGAYYDGTSGMIVGIQRGSNYANPFVLFPADVVLDKANLSAASWSNAVAVQYTNGETVYSVFFYQEKVYFNATFCNELGTEMTAGDCATAPIVYVKDAKGNVVEAFVNNGEDLVVSDQLEGTYKDGETTLFVSGYGKATLNGVEGTYVKAGETDAYTITLTVDGAYYEVTLNKENYTCKVVKPMVTITFDAAGKAEVAPMEVNKNGVVVLPTPENATEVFKGWYYDAACTKAVEEEFVPTQNVTLYAKWAEKVVINLVGVLEGDPAQLLLGVGDVIGEFLPEYTLDETNRAMFAGWYLDAEFATTLPMDVALTLADSGTTVYAKWVEYPAYVGTYQGKNIYGLNSGNNGSLGLSLTIDAYGNISGNKTGVVVSYDPETQVITWKESATATTTFIFVFDAETKVLVTNYRSSDTIDADVNVFTQNQEAGKTISYYAVNTPKTEGSTDVGYYAKFVTIGTAVGEKTILIYNQHIYSNIVVESALGQALTVNEIQNSKTVVVRDATTKEVILARGSVGETFKANTETVALDSYFGTYTKGEETVVLDGVGTIVYGEKVGTYTKVEGVSYGFDVYFNDNTEYYQLTLDGSTFTLVKPMVTVEFVVMEGHAPIASIECNMNVAVTLPSGEEEGYVFNGYFLDQAFTQKVEGTFVPTANTVLYAKHSLPAVLTIVFNNGEANQEVIYSVGDTTVVERPAYDKHVFVGWYTTETFEAGTEWTAGEAILEDVTIYAKWEDAPIYNNTYLAIELTGTNANGGLSRFYARTSALLDIDEYGHASCTSYPFRGEWDVTDYDKEAGTLVIRTTSEMYKGYIDKTTGIIVITYDSGEEAVFGEVYVLTPFETNTKSDAVSSSYWNDGLTRAIEYTYNETTYRMFVNENKVYFNVTFKDVVGVPVRGAEAYQSPMLDVYDENGEIIAKFGYNSLTDSMQELDGYEGTYTNTTAPVGLRGTLELNGIREAILNGKKGTYDLPEEEGATFMFDVYIQGVYYEVSVDKEAKTYTIVKPMVTLAFNAEELASDMTITTNKYISISLPVLENPEYAFMGWYKDPELTEKVEGETYRPTKNETLYAKWAQKLNLTLVYNNDLETATAPYVSGTELDMATYAPNPAYQNGKLFKGWFTDEACTTAFTATSLTEATTIYALWEETDPYTVKASGYYSNDYKFVYDATLGAWVSGNKGEDSSKSYLTIEAVADVTVTFQYKVSSEARYDKMLITLIDSNDDSTTKETLSGEVDYTEYTINLKAGEKLRISYEKDSSTDVGSDQVYIKNLTIAGQVVTTETPAK